MLLPLHVFEPRYRALVEHVLEDDAALGVATLRPGYEGEYEGRPPVYTMMGAGVLVRAERLDDGRWNVVLRGTDRVRVLEERPPARLFREVVAARVADVPVSGDDPRAERLRVLVRALAERMPRAAEGLGQLLLEARSPALLADLLAAHVVGEEPLRRCLLEAPDVGERLEVCIRFVGSALLQVEEPGTLH